MKILLIWQNVPDNTQFFNILNPTEQQLELLTKSNACYINSDISTEQQEALDKIYLSISEKEYYSEFSKETDIKLFGSIWKDCEIKESDLPNHSNWDKVFCCGFYL